MGITRVARRGAWPVVAAATLAVTLVGDRLYSIRVMGQTLSAVVTLLLTAVVLVAAVVVAGRRTPAASYGRTRAALLRDSAPTGMVVFLLWAAVDTAAHAQFTMSAAQNLCVYLLFVAAVVLAANASASDTMRRLADAVVVVGWLRAIFYGAVFLSNGLTTPKLDYTRAVAIESLMIMAFSLVSRHRRWALALDFLLVFEIFWSGSRTAGVASLLILAFQSRLSTSLKAQLRNGVIRLVLLAIVAVIAVASVPALRNRFNETNKTPGFSVDIAGLHVNTQGRVGLWKIVIHDHANHYPIIGTGAGTATRLVRRVEPTGGGEPHNDYLRLWHDFGWIGLGLWVVGYVQLPWLMWRRRRTAVDLPPGYEAACLTALAATAIAAITDNVLIYYYAMLPLGVLVGLAIGGGRKGADASMTAESTPDALDQPTSLLKQPG